MVCLRRNAFLFVCVCLICVCVFVSVCLSACVHRICLCVCVGCDVTVGRSRVRPGSGRQAAALSPFIDHAQSVASLRLSHIHWGPWVVVRQRRRPALLGSGGPRPGTGPAGPCWAAGCWLGRCLWLLVQRRPSDCWDEVCSRRPASRRTGQPLR